VVQIISASDPDLIRIQSDLWSRIWVKEGKNDGSSLYSAGDLSCSLKALLGGIRKNVALFDQKL
jgi:hypothetical protein